tara:strand:- start:65 stop:559 length:495 start_codon:yes stop_codon:yes gene_type:complete
MAGFHTKTFLKHDDYMTPKYVWENIKQYIPEDKVIWEPFYGDGKSGDYLTELGFAVVHNDNDFFKNDEGDAIVSNPPFSKTKEIMERLMILDKPFILIMPSAKMVTKAIRENFKDTDNPLQIIIPRKRIQFIKNGEDFHEKKCNFDCYYYCYKMNLPRDIIWLE